MRLEKETSGILGIPQVIIFSYKEEISGILGISKCKLLDPKVFITFWFKRVFMKENGDDKCVCIY